MSVEEQAVPLLSVVRFRGVRLGASETGIAHFFLLFPLSKHHSRKGAYRRQRAIHRTAIVMATAGIDMAIGIALVVHDAAVALYRVAKRKTAIGR